MKKLLFLLLMATAMTATYAKAQGPFNYNYGQNTHKDTVVDAGITYAYINSNGSVAATGITGDYEDLGLELKLAKLTGTPAGYAILQSCNDTANWSNHFGSSLDTFVITNLTTQTHKWTVGAIDYKYYRFKILGGTTQTTKASGKASMRSK